MHIALVDCLALIPLLGHLIKTCPAGRVPHHLQNAIKTAVMPTRWPRCETVPFKIKDRGIYDNYATELYQKRWYGMSKSIVEWERYLKRRRVLKRLIVGIAGLNALILRSRSR